jgi:hypothetical protein
MVSGAVVTLVGAALIWFGMRRLRPSAAEVEEFVTGEARTGRPPFLEGAGLVFGVVGLVAGVMLVTAGLLILLIALT